MTELQYRISDLINFSSQQKPIEFGQAFDSVIADKIAAAINSKKVEVAHTMFGSQDQRDTEEEQDGEAA